MNSNTKLKLGDSVQVICGKQKGKIGNITAINRKTGYVCLDTFPTEAQNLLASKNPSKNETKPKEKSIRIFFHTSNLMAWDEITKQASRVGIRIEGLEKKRFFKKSGNTLENKKKLDKQF
ncbi:MAG: 50S ribosomal protein L24 [Pedobacter sp.]|nr:MAG: 50S ribosomal protein L24 [Pedobacter sp.]